jgi:uncharacterized membrane protein YeaQ/YmgE (transglycosylase-associated protein family)
MEFFIIVLFVGLIFGYIGIAIAENKNVDSTAGFFLGFFLGPIGLIIVALLNSPTTSVGSANPSTVSKGADPFDEADVAAENERKRYAISLGVTRTNGLYCFNGTTYSELEQAILDAETEREINPHDPGSHFMG